MKKLLVLIVGGLALLAVACGTAPAGPENSSGAAPVGDMGSVPPKGPVEVESDFDEYASGSQSLPNTGMVITPDGSGSPQDPAAPTSLSQLFGEALFSPNHEPIGVVREAAVDLTAGKVEYVFVENAPGASSGTWLVLPWSAGQIRPDPGAGPEGKQVLYAQVTNEALSEAPDLNPDQVNGLDAREWEPLVLEYWAGALSDLPASEPLTATTGLSEPATGFILGSTLSNMDVRSLDGAINLGRVQDVLIDPQTGQLRYLLLVPSVDMGIAQRVIPIPLSAVQLNSEGSLDLPLSVETLQNAPSVDQTQLHGITAQQWEDLVEAWWQTHQPAQEP